MRLLRVMLVAMFVLVMAGRNALAQPLADRLPSDALLYIGWAGSEKLAPAYAQSHLKGVLDASAIPELFSEMGPKIVKRLQIEQMLRGEAVPRELLPALLSMGEVLWRRPAAIYVGPLDYSGKFPMPKVAVVCDAGKDAPALSDTANKLAAQIPADVPVKIRVTVWPGDVVVVSNFDFPPRIEESLSQREQFKNAIKQGRADAALTLYFDAEKVVNMASLAMNAMDAKTTRIWQRILLTTGVAGIKRLVVTSGFDGADWGTQVFVEAPQPRMGLLASLLDSQPVSDDLLKHAPQSSNWVAATRFDLAGLLQNVRMGIGGIDPPTGKAFDEGLKGVNQAIGIDLKKDLLGALGDQWLLFNSNETGHGLLGLTLVNPLRDAAALEKTLTSLEKKANALLTNDMASQGPSMSFETTKVGDVTIHYFPIPVVAPCWTIKNNTFYALFFPQVLVGAMEQDGAGKTILTNEDFQTARRRLGLNNNAISISYMDLPKLAPRGYQLVLALQRTALGFADMYGLQTPAMVLPPLNKIQPHLGPSIGATWVDDAGWHYRNVTPFPGADLLGGEQALVSVLAPAGAAIAIPAVGQARQQAMMVQNANNLKQIGLGVHMYANDNKGNLPPDLGAIYTYVQAPMVFVTPMRAQMTAVPAAGKPEDLAKWINENTDYVYVAKGYGKLQNLKGTAQTIIAHEKFELAQFESVYALYADGHVERTPVQVVKDNIEAQKKMVGQK